MDGNEFADAWNFGPFDTDAREVQTVVDKILKCYGKQQLWERDIIENVHEAHFLKLDISKATNKLNWRPKLTLAEATEATAEWYLAFGSADNMLDLTKEQIKRYEAI